MNALLTRAFARVFALFMRCSCASNRLSTTRLDVFEQYAEQGRNIFAFWHSRLFYLSDYYVSARLRCKASILISMSRDGDYGAALVRRFRQDVVRGSSSRGGHRAIRSLIDKLRRGNNIAITPDGPRGPACIARPGIIKLAQITGARIIPVSYDATRKRRLKSWDEFLLIRPFGRVHMAFGEPIRVPEDAGPDRIEQLRRKLEDTLHDLDHICAAKLRDGQPC